MQLGYICNGQGLGKATRNLTKVNVPKMSTPIMVQSKQSIINTSFDGEIPHLFDNNCNAGIEMHYASAKQFADAIEMPEDIHKYLKRYFS